MSDFRTPTNSQQKRRFWQAHVKAFKQSGFNRSEYCRRHDLSYHAMTYWLRRQKHSNSSAQKGMNLVQLPLSPTNRDQSGAQAIVLRVGSRYVIELGQDFNQTTLSRVLSVLESR